MRGNLLRLHSRRALQALFRRSRPALVRSTNPSEHGSGASATTSALKLEGASAAAVNGPPGAGDVLIPKIAVL